MKTKITFFLLFLAMYFTNAQTLSWANAMTGPGGGQGKRVAVDASGNLYTIGSFSSTTDFDPGAGTFTLTPASSLDAYISKLDASGNFVWAMKFGGSGIDAGEAIALDAAGDVYANITYAGGTRVILKLAASGSTVWTKTIGGIGNAITIDASNNIYTTGSFSGTQDFDPSAATYTMVSTSPTTSDIFVTKLDLSGNFLWAKQMGGTASESAYSIGVDASGNVYTAGHFSATADFDPGAGTYTLSSAGNYDIFISKLDASGNFVWAKRVGDFSIDYGNSMVTDASGNSYTTGFFTGGFSSTTDFDPGAGTYTLNVTGTKNAYVLKLDAAGNFVWAKNFGGVPQSIARDASGNIYIVGAFSGSAVDFDPGVGTYTLTTSGSNDGFISKLDPLGNFIMAGVIGGTNNDIANGVVADATGNAYVTGYFNGTADFEPSMATFTLTAPGTTAGYIYNMKLGTSPSGINEMTELDNVLNVYPNPSNGEFTLQLKEKLNTGELIVTDVMGKEILKQEIKNGTQQIELNINTKGLYFVRLESEGKRQIKKVVVQ